MHLVQLRPTLTNLGIWPWPRATKEALLVFEILSTERGQTR